MAEKRTETIMLEAMQELYFNSVRDIGERERTSDGVVCTYVKCSECILEKCICEAITTDNSCKIALAEWYLSTLK